jgi:hypothetical protein
MRVYGMSTALRDPAEQGAGSRAGEEGYSPSARDRVSLVPPGDLCRRYLRDGLERPTVEEAAKAARAPSPSP